MKKESPDLQGFKHEITNVIIKRTELTDTTILSVLHQKKMSLRLNLSPLTEKFKKLYCFFVGLETHNKYKHNKYLLTTNIKHLKQGLTNRRF